MGQRAHVIRWQAWVQQLPMPDIAKDKTHSGGEYHKSPAPGPSPKNQQQRNQQKKRKLIRDGEGKRGGSLTEQER
jgi:hypothetical protein